MNVEATLITLVPWRTLRSLTGTAAPVPAALSDLLTAATPPAAEAAYWRLDNHVVVQGQLFESALGVVGPLVSALTRPLPDFVRERVMDLLVEIGYGEADGDEIAAGGSARLGDLCRDELRCGLWLFYGLLGDEAPTVRSSALDLVDALDPERNRVAAVASSMTADSDVRVARRARRILDRSAGSSTEDGAHQGSWPDADGS
ncbi:hypothetical protein [Cellulomonas telluris]|uniref:hypothetical protein n=1 Tax=Cellulomonas telluris TaxID=2306636 RepID=UPI0010A827F9|nr:hypothetical protein [Cellulomonas telluris]